MSSIHDATPLQLAELVKRRERLARIASRAIVERPKIVEPCEPSSYARWYQMAIEILAEDDGPLTIEKIKRAVARDFGVSRRDIDSQRRTANVILPRHVTYYLAKTMTLRTLPQIGQSVGQRDHTTVLSGFRKIERLILSDPILAARIEAIRNTLGE